MIQELISRAIKQKSIIEFTYDDYHRVVEPHVLGILGREIQFLGYQIDGTNNNPLPGWRRFNLTYIRALTVTDEKFEGRRNSPSGKHSKWDQTLLVVDP